MAACTIAAALLLPTVATPSSHSGSIPTSSLRVCTVKQRHHHHPSPTRCVALHDVHPASSVLQAPFSHSARQPGCWTVSKSRSVSVKSQAEATEELTVDNATVLVVGGGGVGLETLKSLAKAGSWVTAYQRHDRYRKDIEELGAMLAIGDVLDSEGIAKAFRSTKFDAVVCTVGGGTSDAKVDKEGPINLINAAKKAGVKRFILITSIGVGESKAAVTPQTYEVLKTVLLAKEEAEKHLKESGLTWTILRPGGLKSDPANGRAILLEDTTVGGLIPRAEVASVIKQILFDKRTEFKTFSLIDREAVLPPRSLEGVKIFSLA